MKIGELKAGIEGQYGYGHRAMPMMYGAQAQGWSDANVVYTTQAVPATATGIKGGTVQVFKGN